MRSIISGEAQYINDMLPRAGELFGALVLTTIGKGTIKNIDAKDALVCIQYKKNSFRTLALL